MANLAKIGAVHPRWPESADVTLDGFQSVRIVLLDMKHGEDGADYDWRTNTGGTVQPTILYHGPASFDLYRFTLTMDDVAGSVGQFRPGRFLVDQDQMPDIFVGKGMQIRITEAANNPWLRYYQFVVTSGLNGSLAFRRIIDCETNLSVAMDPFVVPGGTP